VKPSVFCLVVYEIDYQTNVFIDRDTICDMGGATELANYGEYSGAPSEQQTYDYAKTILSLMCKQVHPQGVHGFVLKY